MTATTISWNTEQLVQLESALQIYFEQPRVIVGLVRSSSSSINNNNNHNLLPLNDFYGLTRKLSLPSSAGGTNATTNKQQQQQEGDRDEMKGQGEKQYDDDLDEMELLLFQLLCVSYPILYRLTTSPTDDDNESSNNIKKCWCLERIMTCCNDNRIAQLQKLVHERDNAKASQTNAQAQIFLQAIREDRKLRQESQQPTKVGTFATRTASYSTAAHPAEKQNIKVTADDSTIIQPGMTVEERVRARANAKRKFQEEEEEKLSQTTTDLSKDNGRSCLVRLADALWSHASSILQRQARFQSPQRSITTTTTTTTTTRKAAAAATLAPSHCSLTLKDVIQFLRQSSSIPFNKRKIAEGIQELHRIVPEWIVLSNPASLSPDTTVWLNPAEYKTIRYRLTGEEPPSPPKKKAFLDVNHHPNSSSKTTTTTLRAGGTATCKAATVAAAGSSSNGPLNKLVTKIQQQGVGLPMTKMTTRRRQTPAVSMSPSCPAKLSGTKRACKELNATTTTTTTTTSSSSTPSTASTPVTRSNTTSTPPVTKRRKGLRVNPNLILTDADYEGGEVIRPTSFDSPRGLKSLFAQMQAGRRI